MKCLLLRNRMERLPHIFFFLCWISFGYIVLEQQSVEKKKDTKNTDRERTMSDTMFGLGVRPIVFISVIVARLQHFFIDQV